MSNFNSRGFPYHRGRRLRISSNLRDIVSQVKLSLDDLVMPYFIKEIEDNSEKGYKLIGDVDFDNVKNIASNITPVPGGIGPMTIAILMKQIVEAREHQRDLVENTA